MGLHDRDYARSDQPPRRPTPGRASRPASGAGGGEFRWPSQWSMTGWLIAINIAVFLLGIVLVSLPNARGFVVVPSTIEWREGATFDQKWRSGVRDGVPDIVKLQQGLPRVDPDTRQIVGVQHFRLETYDRAVGAFSTYSIVPQLEIWRFITFQFLHASLTHLLMNMLSLWVFGLDVEEYLGRRKFLALYLVCGIFGACTYMVLNLLGNTLPVSWRIPGLLFDDVFTPLVGASAGIFGIMLAAAFIVPQRLIYVFGIIPIRVKAAVYLFLGIAAINLLSGSNNAGGEAAHIGGAVAGYFFVRRMYLLRDFFEVFSRRSPAGQGPAATRAPINRAEVDRILEKITATGTASLTDDERDTLRRARAALQATEERA